MGELNFCSECAGPLVSHRVGGELRGHAYCPRCAQARYDHALVVVTTFVACERRLLWVQRALEPQRGRWAIPSVT